MHCWMSIEVFDGPYSATLWADAHRDALIEAAVTGGAIDWEAKRTAWGTVIEMCFPTEADWLAFEATDAVRRALATAPDPRNGVLIYRGRSLDGGNLSPRKPKPKAGSGAAAVALPLHTRPFFEPLVAFFTDSKIDRRALTHSN